MKALILLALSGVAFTSVALAAGDSHGHGGPTDLIAPFVNVAILLGFLVWKLKTPFSEFFNQKSTDISNMLERANAKAKEAEVMMEMHKKKIEGAEEEIKNIQTDADNFIKGFEAEYKTDVENRIAILKTDAGHKIEAEKKELLDELNSNLLDEVLAKTKGMLKKDQTLGENAAKQILEGIK
jgi:F0F1-type ATP synthase membrane subunit b/b'